MQLEVPHAVIDVIVWTPKIDPIGLDSHDSCFDVEAPQRARLEPFLGMLAGTVPKVLDCYVSDMKSDSIESM